MILNNLNKLSIYRLHFKSKTRLQTRESPGQWCRKESWKKMNRMTSDTFTKTAWRAREVSIDVSKKRHFQNDKDEQILPAMRIMKDSTVAIPIIWDL